MIFPFTSRRNPAPWSQWIGLLSLFAMVFGARLWLIRSYGSDVPFSDLWDAEALLIKRLLEGHLCFHDLIIPYNEHPMLFPRLLVVFLFKLNAQWDPLLEMTFNAGIVGLMAVFLAKILFGFFGNKKDHFLILLLLGIIFSLPYAWENTLLPFQGFYMLLFFSLIGIFCVGTRKIFSPGWWVGSLSLALACLCTASGLFASLAVIFLIVLRRLRSRSLPDSSDIINGILCILIIFFGWTLKGDVPSHESLKAHSAGEFLTMLGRCLAWPYYQFPGMGLLMYLPLIALLGIYLFPAFSGRKRDLPVTSPDFLLGLGFWVFLQILATSYARGTKELVEIAGRYMDFLAIGSLLNFLALLFLFREYGPLLRRLTAIFGGAWLIILTVGLYSLTRLDFSDELPFKIASSNQEIANMRGYLLTGDFSFFKGKSTMEISYANTKSLAAFLDDPTIRDILPYNVHLPLGWTILKNEGFIPNGQDPKTFPSEPHIPSAGSFFPEGKDSSKQSDIEMVFSSPHRFPYLCIEVAGDPEAKGVSLTLLGERSGKEIRLERSDLPPSPWRSYYAHQDGASYHLKAADKSPNAWIAVRYPVEVITLSYLSIKILRYGRTFFRLSLIGFVLCAYGTFFRLREDLRISHAT